MTTELLLQSPYVVGNAVFDNEKFFGRTDVIDWAVEAVANPNNNSLVLVGQRRIGKTSLLRRLQRILADRGHQPVYFDLQDEGKRPLREVLADLAEEIADQLDVAFPDPDDFDNRGRFFRKTFLPSIIGAMDDRSRLVLLIDEFEAVDPTEEADLDESSAARALQPFLRKLMTREPRLAFVFAMGRSAEELSTNVKATFKGSQQRKLWVLDELSTIEVIRQGEVVGGLRFTDDGVDRVVEIAGRHPFLTQLLCQCVWEVSTRKKTVDLPAVVNAKIVEMAVDLALETGSGPLDWVWEGMAPAEKIFSAALAGISDEGEAVSVDKVMAAITKYAPKRRNPEIIRAKSDLVTRGILQEAGEERYRFEFELFRQWVKMERPLWVVDGELDRLKPEAEEIFLLGMKVLRQRTTNPHDAREQKRHACDYFHRVLEINPDHSKAHLALGRTLLELGAKKRAITALERANELDPKAARLVLVEALLDYAQLVHAGGDEHFALQLAERVLQLSPEERIAQRIRAEIHTAWGDRAETEEEKLGWYQKAGNVRKAQEIQSLIFIREESFENVSGAIRAVIDALQFATNHSQRSSITSPSPSTHAIWGAASVLFKKEQEGMIYLGKAIDGLKRKKWRWVEENLDKVKAVKPTDDSPQDAELSRTRTAGSGTWESAKFPDTQQAQEYTMQSGAAVTRLVNLVGSLSRLWDEAQSLAIVEKEKEAVKLWERVLERVQEKVAAANAYLEGVRSLNNDDFNAARRRLGWRQKKPPFPGKDTLTQEVFPLRPSADAGDALKKAALNERLVRSAMTPRTDPRYIERVGFPSDDAWVMAGNVQWIKAWALKKKAWKLQIDDKNKPQVENFCFSADGSLVAVIFVDTSVPSEVTRGGNVVRVWSVEQQAAVYKIHHPGAASVAFSEDGNQLAMGARDGCVKLYDLAERSYAKDVLENETAVHCMSFSRAAPSRPQRLLAVGNASAEVRLWNVEDRTCLHVLEGAGGPVNDVVFSADGALLAAAFSDGSVRVWSVDSGAGRHELAGHRGSVRSVSFHPNGYLLASGSFDGTVCLWRLADSELLNTLDEEDGAVTALRFSSNGNLLAWGTPSGNVRLWSTLSEDPPVALGEQEVPAVLRHAAADGPEG